MTTTTSLGRKTSSCEDLLPLLGITHDEYVGACDDAQFAIQQLWLSLIAWDDDRMCYRWDHSLDAATVNDFLYLYGREIFDEVGNVRK